MGNPHGKWSSKATKLETTIWAIRLMLICVGIVSCLALLKAAVIPYASTFIISTIPCMWNSVRVLFSRPFISIIVHCIIIAITALTFFPHQIQNQNHLGRRPDRTSSSLYSQKSQVLETQFTDKGEGTVEEQAEVIKPMITDISSNTWGANRGDNPSNAPNATLSDNPSDTSRATLPHKAAMETSGKISPESDDRKSADGSDEEEEQDDSLDSVWKAIVEGQGKQPTAQLNKSDTWDTAARQVLSKTEMDVSFGDKVYRKSETFKERTTNATAKRAVIKEKSMGQEDDLKPRIEAFIRDMRLQREESERRFIETMNHGIH